MVDLHEAVMPRICNALGRQILNAHPDDELAEAVKADLLSASVAVDLHARVQFEHEAKATYRTSPWASDIGVEEVVRPTTVQTNELVPPRSVAREAAYQTAFAGFVCN